MVIASQSGLFGLTSPDETHVSRHIWVQRPTSIRLSLPNAQEPGKAHPRKLLKLSHANCLRRFKLYKEHRSAQKAAAQSMPSLLLDFIALLEIVLMWKNFELSLERLHDVALTDDVM